MRVKICGITRADDAAAAVELGADAIGFVFWQGSPRFIDPYRALPIARTLPALVSTVGVFVNQPASYVNDVASLLGLQAVQLHGDEPLAYLPELERPVIKAVTSVETAGDWPGRVTLLVDAADPVRRGGTGMRADWAGAARLARSRRVLLAGGLSPENVAQAIAEVEPFGIDVSSGVEASPGVKDHARLRALFASVTAAVRERSIAGAGSLQAVAAAPPDAPEPAEDGTQSDAGGRQHERRDAARGRDKR